MARVTLATLKRLDAVERGMFNDTGERRGGVLRVPPILGLDEWQTLAMTTQVRLAQAAAEDIQRSIDNDPAQFRHALPDPVNPQIEGVHFHRPDPHRRQDAPPLPPKPARPPAVNTIR